MNYYLGGDPTVDTLFTLLKPTKVVDPGNFWTYYTGTDDYLKTRSFKSIFGYPESKVV